MILGNWTAWIESPNGHRLEEYMPKEVSDNTIECWVPSTEGINFRIGYGCLDLPKVKDLRCSTTLDGISIGASVSRNMRLRTQKHDFVQDVVTSATTRRLLAFGKRILTDQEGIASSKGQCPEDLNAIKVVLEWGTAGESFPRINFQSPKENGPIHEKAAKKGHSGSAGLGEVVEGRHGVRSTTFVSLDEDPVTFIFRYGPEGESKCFKTPNLSLKSLLDWLQARGIIPSSHSSSRKRGRDTKDDIIDIDDLETDDDWDDEITVIKHLVPVPAAPQKKRQKIKGEEDAKPQLE